MITSSAAITRIAEREPAPSYTPPATGYESPQQAADAGWLGQTPPPAPPTRPSYPPDQPVRYAVSQLAPEPWKDNGSLWGNDPTLFG